MNRSFILLACVPVFAASCVRPAPTISSASLYPEQILSRAERQKDVALKVDRICTFLKGEKLAGLYIKSAPNYAWATSGAEGCAPLYVREDGRRFAMAPNGDCPKRIVDDLVDMGYEVKHLQRDAKWDPGAETDALLRELSGGLPYTSDVSCGGSARPTDRIAGLRVPLTVGEIREYRWLGGRAAESVERVCAGIQPWMTDKGIEVLLSDSLLQHSLQPVTLDVRVDVPIPESDGGIRRDVAKLRRWACVHVCARRWGLQVALTRQVCFGALSADEKKQLKAAARINAGFWARTLPDAGMAAILQGAAADYRESGFAVPGSLGGAIGYQEPGWKPASDAPSVVQSGQAFAWSATVDDIRIEDTILLDGERMEVLTQTADWPRVESKAMGRIYRSPGILQR